MSQQYPDFRIADDVLDEGTSLLEASAGTGKTYTITGILLRMLLEDVVPEIEHALVVTFTVAAADELKNRLRDGLARALLVCEGRAGAKQESDPFFAGLARHGKKGAEKLRRALDDFDRASVTTIHSFCKQLLDEAAFESDEPFDLEFAVDESPLWHTAAADALRAVRRYDGPTLGAVLHEASLDPDALVKVYRGWQRHPDVALDPAEPHLDTRLETLRARISAAASLWDDDVAARVATLNWKNQKGRPVAPWSGDALAAIARLGDDLRTRPELQLATLAALSPRALDETVQRRAHGTDDRPFHLACEAVREAWQQTRDHLMAFLLQQMHDRLQRIKQDQAVLTFDDLLARAHRAVTDPVRQERVLPALRRRFTVALIDEFQDTDQRQYEILAQAFHGRPLFLVGDPKQSIYGFRGADLGTYLAAAQDALHKSTLGQNFRSSAPLVDAVNLLFGKATTFVEPGIRMPKVRAAAAPGQKLIQGDGEPAATLRFRFVEAFEQLKKGGPKDIPAREARELIAADVTAEIRRLLDGPARLDDRALLPRDIAVLTRRNLEAVLVQEHLRAAGIVSVIGKAGDVFETDELIELQRLLLAIQRPNDLQLARAAMATRIWGLDAAALAALGVDDGAFEEALARLERWRHLWIARGFVVMKEQLLRELDVESRYLQRNDGERRLTNLQQLCEMLHQAEHEHRLSPEGLGHWLLRQTQQKDEMDYQRRELRLESDADAVQILTMHGSKGLQYEVVFCPFLWDGRPAPHEHTPLVVDGDPQDAPPRRRFALAVDKDDPEWLRSEGDRLAEDVRLAYVALTRARRRCYVHWGPIGSTWSGWYRSALGWLLNPRAVDLQQPGWQEAWQKQLKDDGASLLATVQELAQRSDGAITVDVAPRSTPPAPLEAASVAPIAVGATTRRPHTPPPLPQRAALMVHSFTSLVAGGAPPEDAHEVRDPDEVRTDPAADADATAVPTGIFGFARGAEPGQCLHAVLEHAALDAVDSPATRELVQRTLRQYGLAEPGAHVAAIDPEAAVLDNLRALAAAAVQAGGPTLGALCSEDRLAEWQFTLPLGAAPDPQALAKIFAGADCPVANAYATRLGALPRQRCAGFLTGFVDLVARHEGRYWVLDWKSNWLGDRLDDYAEPALARAMHGHDYVLQYHLYVLAWHRHLRSRVADYDYDRHFGGVCYVFLRGAAAGSTSGMFTTRPPRALVEALDAWATRGGGR